jgi:phage repressor protein C with HTH and peptisase S24 domain
MKFNDFFKKVSKSTQINSQKELAKILGVRPSAITNVKKEAREVPRIWLMTIASTFGVNLNWLETGAGDIYQQAEQTIHIPKVSARACAGGGSLEIKDNIIDELPFAKSWITSKGNHKNMVIMEVVGDSMSPELEPGDNILVDQNQTQPAGYHLYVVSYTEGLFVKRIQAHPEVIILFSTNPKYPPVTLKGDLIETLNIIGRVIWSSRVY